ncbi:hypothetical protein CL634_02020 [bacterium]|nr:hypothetical protein [bacterium]|tara:strand:- start:29 stop:892 length:864 start_codon:yes stop_codon:yes gene_type:complete
MTIVCTADQEYLPLLKILVKSIARNSPNVDLFIRLVNCEYLEAQEIEKIHPKITFLFDRVALCSRRKKLQRSGAPLQDEMFGVYDASANPERFRGAKWLYSEKMAYCSNIKFNTINLLLNKGTESIMYMDADAIVRGSLDELEKISKKYDISMLVETGDESFMPDGGEIDGKKLPRLDYYDRLTNGTKESNYTEWHAGLFTIKNNHRTRAFFKTMERKISAPAELYDWEADQTLFNETYQETKDLSVYCLPKKFKDEEFSDNSFIWSGAGEHKFQAEKFIKEQQLYS